MLDAAGKPTEELQGALEQAGLTFDDLVEDAVNVIQTQKPGADPGQVARKALFAQERIPGTRGEITQGAEQIATEQKLLQTVADPAAEPLRQYKLSQSEKIKESLRTNLGDISQEETGTLIQDALTGRKKLLRSQKNDLYQIASENAKEAGGIPLFTDNIKEVIPDADTFEDLAITAPQSMDSLNKILVKYGIMEPSPGTISKDFTPTPLTIDNFERFRKTLNAIGRGDQTGAANVAIGPIKEALDTELDEIGSVLASKGISKEIIEPLKKARKTVRKLKTEFSPQSTMGKIIDVKKDGVTPITEASKVYQKMAGKAVPVEDTRKLMGSLNNSGERGKGAIASIQASTIFDLIDAGFGTESRKISGIKTFNPIAFKRRLKNIGQDKINAIFRNNPRALKRLKNIDKIATEITPPSDMVPKGSAPIILDLANKLGMASIATKIPGGALLVGAAKGITDPIKKGVQVRRSMMPEPDINNLKSLFEQVAPNLAATFATPAAIEQQNSGDK